MGEKWRRRAPVVGGALVVTLALALLTVSAPADAVRADSAPTWAEVQAARNNARAAADALSRIQNAVAVLEAQEKAATDAQLQAAYTATQAANELQAAQAKSAALDAQLTTAKKQASDASARFVATEVQLSRLGGGDDITTRLLATGGRSTDLLGKLSALDQLGKRSAQLESTARQKQNLVTSLASQASRAEKARTALKADADAKLQAAQAAQATAQQAVAAGQAQLADLQQKATTLNRAYQLVSDSYTQNQKTSSPPAGSTGGAIDTSGVVADPAGAQAYARQAIGRYGWGDDQFSCLVTLWNIESGWRANAYNKSSGAYGIPQALPANKMASAGADWLTNGNTQIDWGLGYIKARYGTPCGALAFETSHSPYWY